MSPVREAVAHQQCRGVERCFALGVGEHISQGMPRRRADTTGCRLTHEFDNVRVSRLRATGVIDPAKRQAVIPFPNGENKLIAVAHTKLKYGGRWSYFICPKMRPSRADALLHPRRAALLAMLRSHEHQAPQQMGPRP